MTVATTHLFLGDWVPPLIAAALLLRRSYRVCLVYALVYLFLLALAAALRLVLLAVLCPCCATLVCARGDSDTVI